MTIGSDNLSNGSSTAQDRFSGGVSAYRQTRRDAALAAENGDGELVSRGGGGSSLSGLPTRTPIEPTERAGPGGQAALAGPAGPDRAGLPDQRRLDRREQLAVDGGPPAAARTAAGAAGRAAPCRSRTGWTAGSRPPARSSSCSTCRKPSASSPAAVRSGGVVGRRGDAPPAGSRSAARCSSPSPLRDGTARSRTLPIGAKTFTLSRLCRIACRTPSASTARPTTVITMPATWAPGTSITPAAIGTPTSAARPVTCSGVATSGCAAAARRAGGTGVSGAVANAPAPRRTWARRRTVAVSTTSAGTAGSSAAAGAADAPGTHAR